VSALRLLRGAMARPLMRLPQCNAHTACCQPVVACVLGRCIVIRIVSRQWPQGLWCIPLIVSSPYPFRNDNRHTGSNKSEPNSKRKCDYKFPECHPCFPSFGSKLVISAAAFVIAPAHWCCRSSGASYHKSYCFTHFFCSFITFQLALRYLNFHFSHTFFAAPEFGVFLPKSLRNRANSFIEDLLSPGVCAVTKVNPLGSLYFGCLL